MKSPYIINKHGAFQDNTVIGFGIYEVLGHFAITKNPTDPLCKIKEGKHDETNNNINSQNK